MGFCICGPTGILQFPLSFYILVFCVFTDCIVSAGDRNWPTTAWPSHEDNSNRQHYPRHLRHTGLHAWQPHTKGHPCVHLRSKWCGWRSVPEIPQRSSDEGRDRHGPHSDARGVSLQ
ncbi:hypothetical protein E2C01_094953 [Portunus trituberculatus]|uniref:Uncharacterized protein n=1 Tax=Portunus trituberculatus TaxID=210409 RepID=A0A5B7JYK1_PORTR|nr:hypothetical protein [Portunus trituberculatus]